METCVSESRKEIRSEMNFKDMKVSLFPQLHYGSHLDLCLYAFRNVCVRSRLQHSTFRRFDVSINADQSMKVGFF